MTGSHHEEFDRRARNYRHLDARLAAHTRFFAAAALTNSVLAELCAHRARWVWISQTTLGALLTLGGMLEALNLRRADSLDTPGTSDAGGTSGASLDAYWVEMEQAYVESVLCGWARSCAPRCNRLIAELDRLLLAVANGLLPPRCSSNVRRYEQVLRSVTRAAGHCPRFAICADRISIGKALIQEARRQQST